MSSSVFMYYGIGVSVLSWFVCVLIKVGVSSFVVSGVVFCRKML